MWQVIPSISFKGTVSSSYLNLLKGNLEALKDGTAFDAGAITDKPLNPTMYYIGAYKNVNVAAGSTFYDVDGVWNIDTIDGDDAPATVTITGLDVNYRVHFEFFAKVRGAVVNTSQVRLIDNSSNVWATAYGDNWNFTQTSGLISDIKYGYRDIAASTNVTLKIQATVDIPTTIQVWSMVRFWVTAR
jgi:hypothetical protein